MEWEIRYPAQVSQLILFRILGLKVCYLYSTNIIKIAWKASFVVFCSLCLSVLTLSVIKYFVFYCARTQILTCQSFLCQELKTSVSLLILTMEKAPWLIDCLKWQVNCILEQTVTMEIKHLYIVFGISIWAVVWTYIEFINSSLLLCFFRKFIYFFIF